MHLSSFQNNYSMQPTGRSRQQHLALTACTADSYSKEKDPYKLAFEEFSQFDPKTIRPLLT